MSHVVDARGTRAFFIIWLGQFISALGSGLGSFALGVWVFQKSGSVTPFAMIPLLFSILMTVLAPVAGVVVDRVDRRRLLIICETGAGVATAFMAYFISTGHMEVWHTYIFIALMATFVSFQAPALYTATPLLVPREHLARANGMIQTCTAAASIIGPLSAGVLINWLGFPPLFLIDFATFCFAAATLLLVRIPRPVQGEEGAQNRSLLRGAAFGLYYLRTRPGLMSLLLLYAFTNFSIGMVQVLLTPLILGFATPAQLGTVNAAGAVGGLVGGIALGIWGGPRRKVWGIFGVLIFQGLLLFLGGLKPSVPLVATASFAAMLVGPIMMGSSQAIWQSKVAHDLQGRVFAVSRVLSSITLPLAYVLAGPLSDKIFEPALQRSGALADSVGRIIGTGPGRGVALLLILLGCLILLVTCLSYLNPRLRRVEIELPDAAPPPSVDVPPSPPLAEPTIAAG